MSTYAGNFQVMGSLKGQSHEIFDINFCALFQASEDSEDAAELFCDSVEK